MEYKVKINVNNRNITSIKEKNPNLNINSGDVIELDIKNVNSNSKVKFDAICTLCNSINNISIEKYYKNISRQNYYSCRKCANVKRVKTNNELYGVDNVMTLDNFKQKGVETTLEKYGYTNAMLVPELKAKFVDTMQKNHNVDYPMQNKNIKDKSKLSLIDKYGVDHYSKTNMFKNQSRLKWIEELKTYFINENEILISIDDITLDCVLHGKCNHNYTTNRKLYYGRKYLYNVETCTVCNKKYEFSGIENILINYIKTNYKGNIILNDRNILNGLELDIYLPDLNLAFEINGLFWHCEKMKPNDYHLNKTDLCLEKNIDLIHIWEDDINFKFNAVINIINSKLNLNKKIFGRKTLLKEVDNNTAKLFHENYHIQGGNVLNNLKTKNYGLFYNDELLTVMSFCKKRHFIGGNHDYELLRLSTKLNYTVVGGASKMLNEFKKHNKGLLISYCDKSRSNGNVYNKIGFNLINTTSPGYFYFKKDIKINRFKLRKSELIKLGGIGKTEHELALNLKYYRIYDCGQYVYQLNIL